MTFYYDEEADELVGNNVFHDDVGFGTVDGDTLRLDVTAVMEDGRGLRKLHEMRDAIEGAIETHEDT